MLDLARHDRRARAARARGCLGALRNDDLVVHVLIDHVELVDVAVPRAVFRRNEHDDTWWRARRDVIDPDFRQLNALGIKLGPTLHQKFWDLGENEVRLCEQREVIGGSGPYLDKPHSAVA